MLGGEGVGRACRAWGAAPGQQGSVEEEEDLSCGAGG